ncbi:MAG TPA: hypothetical protein VG962_11375 [Steroidobacteraceae bacterium]|nr:hypothetical protein [Steroidobacteraceae bacterium]
MNNNFNVISLFAAHGAISTKKAFAIAMLAMTSILSACGGGGGSGSGGVSSSSSSASSQGDVTPPTAAIVFPTPSSYTDASSVVVRGSAADSSGVKAVSVNGVQALSNDGFMTWTASVPIPAHQTTTLTVSVTDLAGNINSAAATSVIRNGGPVFSQPRALAMDSIHSRLLLTDLALKGEVYGYALADGAASVVSDITQAGYSTRAGTLDDIVIDQANNRAIALDWGDDTLMAINLTTGVRTAISPSSNATSGTSFISGYGVALNSSGSAAYVTVSSSNTVVAVNLSTGARTVLSGPTVGTGAQLYYPSGIVYDAVTVPSSPRLLVSSSNAIVAIDIATGNRSILSSNSPYGSGRSLVYPIQLRLDRTNMRLLVTDVDPTDNSLIAIDLATGNRTVLADKTTGSGIALTDLAGLAVNADGSTAYLAQSTGEIVSINLQTLSRTLFSQSYMGGGPHMKTPVGLVLENHSGAPASLLSLDSTQQELFRCDIATGDRTVISGGSVGSGVSFSSVKDVVLDTRPTSNGSKAFVLDGGSNNLLISVNLATGARTQVANLNSASPPMVQPRSIFLDANGNRVFVVDGLGYSLFAIDIATGNRSTVSSPSIGTGNNFFGTDMVLLSSSGTMQALATDLNSDGIVSINLATGNRSTFAAPGFPITLPIDLTLDSLNQQLIGVSVNDGTAAIFTTDLAGGGRRLISGQVATGQKFLGGGPALNFSSGLAVDAINNVAYVSDGEPGTIYAIDLMTGERVIISR